MEKQKITSLQIYDKDKDGNTLKTRDGKVYERIIIKTDRHGENSLSGFVSKATQDWKVGSEIEIEVTTVSNGKGGFYYNFKTPKAEDKVNQKLEQILNGQTTIKLKLEQILELLRPNRNFTSAGTKVPDFSEVDLKYPTDEINPDDVPF